MKAILFFTLICLFDYCHCQTPANDPHWVLEWSDDFNNNTIPYHPIPPDPTYWDVLNNSDGGQNIDYGGPVVWRSSINNVFINEDGYLTLKLIHEDYTCPTDDYSNCQRQGGPNGAPYHYTSGLVSSKQSIQFGYIEARIKCPGITGLWDAFWLFGNDLPNDPYRYNEIDVFEMDPFVANYCPPPVTHTHNVMPTSIHTMNYSTPGWPNPCTDPHDSPSLLIIPYYDYTDFHTYGIEWSPSRIIWYVDGFPVRYYRNTEITLPQHLIMSLCIHETGSPYFLPMVNNNELPQEMYIDWVKVYSLKTDCNDFIHASNYDFSTYNNREKNFIDIGEGGGVNSLSPGDDIKLRASHYIAISGKFEVPPGARFYADVDKSCNTNVGIQCSQTFNPCEYIYANYDNTLKKKIELGGNGCTHQITPVDSDIILQATDEITLKAGVTITPTSIKSVELKIRTCF